MHVAKCLWPHAYCQPIPGNFSVLAGLRGQKPFWHFNSAVSCIPMSKEALWQSLNYYCRHRLKALRVKLHSVPLCVRAYVRMSVILGSVEVGF